MPSEFEFDIQIRVADFGGTRKIAKNDRGCAEKSAPKNNANSRVW